MTLAMLKAEREKAKSERGVGEGGGTQILKITVAEIFIIYMDVVK
jgi:hypothetical protein